MNFIHSLINFIQRLMKYKLKGNAPKTAAKVIIVGGPGKKLKFLLIFNISREQPQAEPRWPAVYQRNTGSS